MSSASSLSSPRPARSRLLHAFALVFGAATILLASPMSQADVWGFVDASGVGHYANHQIDPRYVLFFREKASAKDASNMKRTLLPPGRAVDVAMNFSTLNSSNTLPAVRLGTGLEAVAAFNKSPQFKLMRQWVKLAAKTQKVDAELLQAIIATESGFDHTAVSAKGAIGLMQLMPPTAVDFGVQADSFGDVPSKLTDPKTNIMAGARYVSYLLKKYPGQLELAIAAYNSGEGSVKSAGNQVPDFKETQNYVRSVLGLYASLKPGVAIPDLSLIGARDAKAVAAIKAREQKAQLVLVSTAADTGGAAPAVMTTGATVGAAHAQAISAVY
mgnify:CR=1 FL=1